MVVTTTSSDLCTYYVITMGSIILNGRINDESNCNARLIRARRNGPPLVIALRGRRRLVVIASARALRMDNDLITLLLRILMDRASFLASFTYPGRHRII